MTLYFTHQNITFYFKHVVAFYAAAYKFPLKCYPMKESQHRIARWILWIRARPIGQFRKILVESTMKARPQALQWEMFGRKKKGCECFISSLWVWWHPKSSFFFREDPKLLEKLWSFDKTGRILNRDSMKLNKKQFLTSLLTWQSHNISTIENLRTLFSISISIKFHKKGDNVV